MLIYHVIQKGGMDIVTKRNGNVWQIGNTIGLSLREEILDIGADIGTEVTIMVIKENNKKKIVIEK